jgi:hypothetical protein
MKTKFLLLLFTLSVFFVSCDDDTYKNVEFDLDEFQMQRAQWYELNLQNYSYEYSNSGNSGTGLSSHILMEIENGVIGNVISLENEDYETGDTILINDLFDQIENRYPINGIVENSRGGYLTEIRVEYDSNYHYPSEVHYIHHIPKGYDGLWNMHQYIKNFKLVE